MKHLGMLAGAATVLALSWTAPLVANDLPSGGSTAPSGFGSSGSTRVAGNLSVVSQIAVSCTTPSPNGNLTLPFVGTSSLTSQPISYPVTIASKCTGGGVISHLEFGDGLYATDDSSTNAGVAGSASHTFTRRMRGQNRLGDYLAYKMYADSEGSVEIENSVTGTDDCAAAVGGCNNAYYFSGSPNQISLKIYGRIHDDTGTYADQYRVNGDIYNDTVVMTLHYND